MKSIVKLTIGILFFLSFGVAQATTLGVQGGGTGNSTFSVNCVPLGNGINPLNCVATSSLGISGGSGALSSAPALTLQLASTTAGQFTSTTSLNYSTTTRTLNTINQRINGVLDFPYSSLAAPLMTVTGTDINLGTGVFPFINSGGFDFSYGTYTNLGLGFAANTNNGTTSGATGVHNTGFGYLASSGLTSGSDNLGFGFNALGSDSTGNGNIVIGSLAAIKNNGDHNTIIGSGDGTVGSGGAGVNLTAASGDTFLGYQAGLNETGSNLLYITNSSTASPLIKGDFSASTLTINGAPTFTGTTTLNKNLQDSANSSGTLGQILSSTGTSTRWITSSSSGSGTVNSGNTGNVAFYNATGTAVVGTSSITIAPNGNVGIGTVNPSQALDMSIGKENFTVNGNTSLNYQIYAATIAGDNRLIFTGTSFGGGSRFWFDSPSGNPAFSMATNGVEQSAFGPTGFTVYQGNNFHTTLNGTDRFTILNSSGNVGLGTTTPGTTLVVVGTTTSAGFQDTTRTNAYAAFDGSGNIIATTTPVSGGGGSGNSAWTIATGSIFNATSSDRVTIGTSSPFAKLSIQGTFGSTTPIFDVASTTSAASATSSIFTVAGNNMVGVGTNVPTNRFQVFSSAADDTAYFAGTAPHLALGNTSVYASRQYDVRFSLATSNNNFWTGSAAGDAFLMLDGPTAHGKIYFSAFDPGGVRRPTMALTDNDLLGIGSTTPSAKLTVQGTSGTTTPIFTVASSSATAVFSIDSSGHEMTGGVSPTCGANCSSISGDDNTMFAKATSGASASLTINFAATWKNAAGTAISPACFVSAENGASTGPQASSTPTTVTVTATSITTNWMAIHCQGSFNATF